MVPGDVGQDECQGDGIGAELELTGGDAPVLRVVPLKVRVQVACGTAGQGDVIAFDGALGFDGQVLGVI